MAGRTGWLLSDGPNPYRDPINIPDAQWGWPIYLQNWVVLGVYVLHLGSFGGKCIGKYTMH